MAECVACGRILRARNSLMRRYGRDCWNKVLRASAVLCSSPNKAANKAGVALQEGAARRVAPGRYQFPSGSNAGVFYTTTTSDCDCPSGVAGRLCFHRVVVEILCA